MKEDGCVMTDQPKIEPDIAGEERERLRRLIAEARLDRKLWLTGLFLTLAFPIVLRIAVETRKNAKLAEDKLSPFIYVMR